MDMGEDMGSLGGCSSVRLHSEWSKAYRIVQGKRVVCLGWKRDRELGGNSSYVLALIRVDR